MRCQQIGGLPWSRWSPQGYGQEPLPDSCAASLYAAFTAAPPGAQANQAMPDPITSLLRFCVLQARVRSRGHDRCGSARPWTALQAALALSPLTSLRRPADPVNYPNEDGSGKSPAYAAYAGKALWRVVYAPWAGLRSEECWCGCGAWWRCACRCEATPKRTQHSTAQHSTAQPPWR
jgi:hypothetical protein